MALAVVEEQRVESARADEDIGPAVVVHVGDRDTQTGGLLRDADGVGHVLELEVALVAEEPGALRLRAVVAGDRVLADEDVEQAVAVVVQDRGAAAAEVLRARTAVLGDVGEVALAVVLEQSAAGVIVRRVGHVAEVEVEVAGVIEVGKQYAGAARRDGEGLLRVSLELALLIAEAEVG